MSTPVIVFHGRNELEAQLARDVLSGSMIPVVHLPSPSMGIFATAQTTRVAVPEEHVEAALSALADAGLEGAVEERAKGAAAIAESVQDALPFHRMTGLEGSSGLARVILGIAMLILVLAVSAVVIRS